MYVRSTNDVGIKSIYQDEYLDSMLKTTSFCVRILINPIDIEQTANFVKSLFSTFVNAVYSH